MSNDRTVVLICNDHPPLSTWPMSSLVTGACPKCGTIGLYSDVAFARMIKALRYAEEIDHRQQVIP